MNRFIRSLPALALIGACASSAAFSTLSQTQIEGGQTFLLGGDQILPVLVEGRNTGPVAVEILTEKNGVRTPVLTVEPQQLFSKSFGARETILVRNTSDTRMALVRVQFNRDVTGLQMRYMPSSTSPAAAASAASQ